MLRASLFFTVLERITFKSVDYTLSDVAAGILDGQHYHAL